VLCIRANSAPPRFPEAIWFLLVLIDKEFERIKRLRVLLDFNIEAIATRRCRYLDLGQKGQNSWSQIDIPLALSRFARITSKVQGLQDWERNFGSKTFDVDSGLFMYI
jgi:hypothetical protein